MRDERRRGDGSFIGGAVLGGAVLGGAALGTGPFWLRICAINICSSILVRWASASAFLASASAFFSSSANRRSSRSIFRFSKSRRAVSEVTHDAA